jgi:hypothetical protein
MSLLPVLPAHSLGSLPDEDRWLVEGLWAEEAVGIVGGEPKCCKSFLALDMAVAVASGTACLRRFQVKRPGRVLLYAAEDPLHVVRRRLEGISCAAGVALQSLDVQVITAPSLRLDLQADRSRLEATTADLRPRLLVLDPFVRLHRIDENASGEVAPLLAFLRELQRRHHLAVIVVHHARKAGGNVRAGQALRGSSEFHAWGDCNLYLRRGGDRLTLTIEHRAAPSGHSFPLVLKDEAPSLALAVAPASDPAADSPPGVVPLSPEERIQLALDQAPGPIPLHELRSRCRIRTAILCSALAALTERGLVLKSADGYRLSARP